MTHEQSDPCSDPRTIRPTLRSMLTTASIHAPNQKPTLRPTTPSIHVDPRRENKEQRTENRGRLGEKREQREAIRPQRTIRPHRTNDYRTTIAEPEPSLDHIHREREEREERGDN